MSILNSISIVIIFSITWSSAFIVGKIGLFYINEYALLSSRFFIASLILLPVWLIKKNIKNKKGIIKDGIILGLLNNVIYLGLIFSSLNYISPELVTIIASCSPFITCIIVWITKVEKFSYTVLLGIILGFLGVLLITTYRPVGSIEPIGILQAFIGTIGFSIATIYYKKNSISHNPQLINFWQSITAAVVLLPFALYFTKENTVITKELILSILYLVIVVTIGSMWLWLIIIKNLGASVASSAHLLNPAIGLILAYIFFQKEFLLTDWIGILVITTGLFIVTRFKKKY
jgi:drug/metabolite transporter (DMT)-like permease